MNIWWQNRNISLYNDIAAFINESNSKEHNILIYKCELLFKALNRFWNDYFIYAKKIFLENEWQDSDIKKFSQLLLTLNNDEKLRIYKSAELQSIIDLEPKIMNHDKLKNKDYNPLNIDQKIIRKSQEDHKRLINSYKEINENNYKDHIDKFICRLAELLYVIRSNIAHGEKTSKGPDLNKRERDIEVCKTVLPLLNLIFELLFDYPSTRIVCYGTLMPGQINSSILEKYNGIWLDGFVKGKIKNIEGLPHFKWNINEENINVKVFESDEISLYELDRFEGKEYKRIWIPVKVNDYFTICNVFESIKL